MAVVKKTYKANVGTAWGGALKAEHAPKIPFSYDVDEFPTFADMTAAGESPSEKQILKFVNDARKNAARQSAQDETLKALGYEKPNTANDDQLRLTMFYKMLRQSKRTHDESVQMAAVSANAEWAEIPEDGDIKF